MSPEQILADPREIDTRTDIHALGVVLFRLLAGRLPFAQGDPPLPELARRIIEDEPTRLGTLNAELRGDIEIITARAMAKEKDRRYPSAAGLAMDLRRYLAGQPISASSDSAWYLVRRRIGRYRLALGLSAAAFVVVAAMALYASVQRTRADRMNDELELQLSTTTIERGRLASLTGNHPAAEELVWRELFRRPDSMHAQWTLWDVYSREPSPWSRLEHEAGTNTVKFSPDGRLLVTAGRVDGEVHIVASESGETLRRFVLEPRGSMIRAMFTPDGAHVVATSADGSLHAWEVASGRIALAVPRATRGLRYFALMDGGARIATVGGRGLEVWSLANGERAADLSQPSWRGSCIAAQSDGRLVAVGSVDGSLTAFDLGSRTPRWRVQAHSGEIAGVSLSPDGQLVISGGFDGRVRIWNASTGEPLKSIAADSGRVRRALFDPSGTILVVGGQWRARYWNMRDTASPPRDLGGSDPVTDFHISPDGRRVATANGGSGQLRMWDLQADSRVRRWPTLAAPLTGMAVADGGTTLLTSGPSTLAFLEPDSPGPVVHPAPYRVLEMDLSDDGRWIVTVGLPAAFAVWDRRDMRRAATLQSDHPSRATIFADGGRQIIAGLRTGEVRVWEWSDGRASAPRTLATSDGEVVGLAVHGSTLFVAHGDRAIVMRDLATGREIRRVQGASVPFAIAVTPDGRTLAAGTYLSAVDVWDTQTGRRLAELKGQTAMIASVDISPDGRLIASSSRDGSTRLWSIAGQFLATIGSRTVPAVRVRFLPGGRQMAIGYDDGEVEMRDLDYYFRYAAGQAEYQLRLRREAGEVFPRAHEVLTWSRRVLSR